MRLVALALILAAPLAAQTNPVDALTEALSLSPAQAHLAGEMYDANLPGSAWTLAAALTPTLSETQRDALLARPDRGARQGRRGDRGGRGQRGARSERGDRPADPSQQAAVRAARDAALGLDADGSARLDAALDGLGRREMMRAVRDGDLPDAVIGVLSDVQAETFRAHLALNRLLRRGGPDA